MTTEHEELAEHFTGLRDEYLLELWNSGTLTEFAMRLADDELGRRGIVHPRLPAMEGENPEPAAQDEVSFVTVARSLNTSTMHILRARLEAEGIPAFVADGNMNQVVSLLSVATGGARLQVPSAFAEAARKIIAAINSGALAATNQDANPSEQGTAQ